jgi:hypothetical protein
MTLSIQEADTKYENELNLKLDRLKMTKPEWMKFIEWQDRVQTMEEEDATN